jgi:multidrug efflux pump
MKLSELSIRRPVFASVMSLVLVLLGIISFTRLPVREYPDIDPPIVSVTTFYRGASPSVIETEITDILEEQFSTIEGIKTMTSSSREQGSVITIEFDLDRDVDTAANDVRDRVARVSGRLPREADDPVVAKVDVDAQPIMWLAFSSDVHTTLELSDVADRVLKERLQRLPGVGSVFIGGERRYAMRIWLDTARLAAHGLTVQDVEEALRRENAEIPGGRVEGELLEFAVRTRGELELPEEFAAVVVARSAQAVVRLSDLAEVEVGPLDDRTVTRYNGRPAVGLGIVKQKQASTVAVARAVRDALPALRSQIAAGMALEIAYDSSAFIEESINEVARTLLLATGLVVLVVLLFLKNLRATIIPIVAIPVAIIGAFTVAFAAGFSLNIITLLALVLAIGLVVDDAIIVLENCFRHLEMGKPRLLAARDGVKEIAFAVIATTVSLVAVFVPVAFLTGAVGSLFREFGITLAVAVVISSFVALTLAPTLCALLLKRRPPAARKWSDRSFDFFFRWLDRFYGGSLAFALRRRWLVIGLAGLLVAGTGWIYRTLPRELVPIEDRGVGFGIVIAPEGSTLAYTDRYQRQIEDILLELPERRGLFSAVGLGFGGPGRVTNGFMFLNLKPHQERTRTQQAIVAALFPQLMAVPGVLAFVVNPPSLGGRFSTSPVAFVLQADTYADLDAGVRAFLSEAAQLGYLLNLDSDLRLNKPQLDVGIDRDRAATLGISVAQIGATLETLLGGRVVGEFRQGSKKYDVVLQLRPANRATPDMIPEIHLRSGGGGLVQMANLVTLAETAAPKELNHFNRVRAATVTANLAPGVDLGRALDDLERLARTALPAGMRYDLTGQSSEYREASGSLAFMFLLAVAFIYLVLAAQFESFVHPLVILLSVPLALVGALASLFAFGQSLNIYSQIGLVMLIGLVTKNAILIVEFANQLRARGRDIAAAVFEAARIRLRPILMTSLSTVFGILPIAVGLGAGAESRRPLGIAIVGGILLSTFLTLILVPVVYSLLAKLTPARPVADFDAVAPDIDATAQSEHASSASAGA